MKKSNYRQGRLAEEIRRIISELLQRGMKDPRFSGFFSISGVEVTADGSYATVYISLLGDMSGEAADEEEKAEILDAFRNAKGFFRKEIGHQLTLRHTPDLLFKIDTSQEYGRHIERVLGELGVKSSDSDEEENESGEEGDDLE